MLIVLNGCFSSGKTTIAQAFCKENDTFAYLDPDLYASPRPRSMKDKELAYSYTWEQIFSAMKVMEKNQVDCITQIVYSPGMTSLKIDSYSSKVEAIFDRVEVFTLLPDLEIIEENNGKRAGFQYPVEALEDCSCRVKENQIGNVIAVEKKDYIDDALLSIKSVIGGLNE
jgi:hypothetical protein